MRVYFRDKVIDFLQNPQPAALNWSAAVDGLDVEPLLARAGDRRRVVIVGEPRADYERFAAQFAQVGAAGGVVQGGSGRVLMIFRRAIWDLPKGHREAGETMEQCALREVEEECGIAGLTVGDELCVTPHIYLTGGGCWEMKRTAWYAMTVGGEPAPWPQTEEGIVDARWMTPSECIAASAESYATIKDVINKYYEKL